MNQPVTQDEGILAEARALPHWLRRYLMLIQSGAHASDAAHQVNANLGIIGSWTHVGGPKYNDVFARALAAVEAGVVLFGAGDTRANAEAVSGGLLEDAIRESRDPSIKPADRRNNRRDVLEVTGLVGSVPRLPGEAPAGLQLLMELRRMRRERLDREGRVQATEVTETETITITERT